MFVLADDSVGDVVAEHDAVFVAVAGPAADQVGKFGYVKRSSPGGVP